MKTGKSSSGFTLINLKDKKLFLFDIDGVLLTGMMEWETRVLGGYRLFSRLRKKGISYALLGSGSNWSTNEAWSYFRSLGFMITIEQLWLASRVASHYLREKLGKTKCLVVGEEGLKAELVKHGHRLTSNWREAEAVVVGHDRAISFKKLTAALRAINNKEAYFLAVNKVRWYYSPNHGPCLSPGAIVQCLEYQTGREAVVVGKPSLIHYQTVLNQLKIKPDEAVMVGDSYEADIAPAHSLGITTVLVSSVQRWERNANGEADLTVRNVDDLIEHIE
ncbi:MAG: HAD-IIA family hydrolase [Candidatus Caldarchaeum sp.]